MNERCQSWEGSEPNAGWLVVHMINAPVIKSHPSRAMTTLLWIILLSITEPE